MKMSDANIAFIMSSGERVKETTPDQIEAFRRYFRMVNSKGRENEGAHPMTTESFQQYARLVDSPENQALHEGERLPMVARWIKIEDQWIVIDQHGETCTGINDPDPIDLQAASGVLAEWLVIMGYCPDRFHDGTWRVFDTGDSPSPMSGTGKYPTMLDAQVAAAGAVLGVKPQSSSA